MTHRRLRWPGISFNKVYALLNVCLLCLSIDILVYVLNWGEQQGRTEANQKRISRCVNCHGLLHTPG